MGISSVLVDRGRAWTNTTRMTVASLGNPSVPVKVEGETVMDWVAGEWFACRIDSPTAAEARDTAQGKVIADLRPTLIFDIEDEAGNPVVVGFNSRVEVESVAIGNYFYEVTGQPTLYRKKEDLIAGEVVLSRIVDDWPAGRARTGFTSMGVSPGGSSTASEAGTSPVTVSESATQGVV